MSTATRIDLDRLQWMKVKRWYLQHNFSPSEICDKLKIPNLIPNLSAAIYRRGWTKIKKNRVMEILQTEQNPPVSTEEQEELDKIDAFKDQSEELLERSFEMGREAVDPKQLQQASSASKNYFDVYNRAHSIKSPQAQTQVLIGVGLFTIGDNEDQPMKQAQPVEVETLTMDVGL